MLVVVFPTPPFWLNIAIALPKTYLLNMFSLFSQGAFYFIFFFIIYCFSFHYYRILGIIGRYVFCVSRETFRTALHLPYSGRLDGVPALRGNLSGVCFSFEIYIRMCFWPIPSGCSFLTVPPPSSCIAFSASQSSCSTPELL